MLSVLPGQSTLHSQLSCRHDNNWQLWLWTCHNHPPCTPDLAPSDFLLFPNPEKPILLPTMLLSVVQKHTLACKTRPFFSCASWHFIYTEKHNNIMELWRDCIKNKNQAKTFLRHAVRVWVANLFTSPRVAEPTWPHEAYPRSPSPPTPSNKHWQSHFYSSPLTLSVLFLHMYSL